MIQQNDSTAQDLLGEEQNASEHIVSHHAPTPYEVSKWMPRDCTPAQLDSAIQVHCKPSEIHWSSMPDTLHLPGQSKGKSFLDVSIPTYYKESFFSKDSLFHPELKGGRLGVAGESIPYTIFGDDLITSILLGCFIFATIAFSMSRRFFALQFKNFFYEPHFGTTEVSETSTEMRFQLFFILQTCLLSGLVFFFWTRSIEDTFTIEQYKVIGIYSAVFFAYYGIKILLYYIINNVFFTKKKNLQWIKSFLFLSGSEGVLLFPIVLLFSFFGASIETVIVYAFSVVLLVKLLTLYKCYIIFFKRMGLFLQNILYFCALEIIPIGALWGTLVIISNYFKINF
nr:DUF4271 domain-containing protein [Prevotella sp.]